MRFNFRILLNSFTRLDRRRSFFSGILLFLISKILLIFPNLLFVKFLQRFLYANDLTPPETHPTDRIPSLELLYVATAKDFQILNLTISTTVDSLSNFHLSKISIIAPKAHIEALRHSLPELLVPVNLISEESLVSSLEIEELKKKFLERYGWVLQQLLKVLFVSQSESDGVLVVDADTALLCQRAWLDFSGLQVLTPTWEYHRPYYEFLQEYKIGKIPPDFTFVPHHMLFQPQIMREILDALRWTESKAIIRTLISSSQHQENSPFSIDYELYAQFLCSFYPEKVSLEKWGNFQSARRLKNGNLPDFIQYVIANSHGKYASVSFHSYLT